MFNFKYIKKGSSIVLKVYETISQERTRSFLIFCLVAVGIVLVTKIGLVLKVAYVLSFICIMLQVSMGAEHYQHYYHCLIIFILPAIIIVIKGLSYLTLRLKLPLDLERGKLVFLWGAIIISLMAAVYINKNMQLKILDNMGLHKTWSDEYVKFAYECNDVIDEMNIDKEKVFGSDGLYYDVLNTLPQIKWFYIPNIPREWFPEPYEEEEDAIKSGYYDAIIIRSSQNDLTINVYDYIYDNYEAYLTKDDINMTLYVRKAK